MWSLRNKTVDNEPIRAGKRKWWIVRFLLHPGSKNKFPSSARLLIHTCVIVIRLAKRSPWRHAVETSVCVVSQRFILTPVWWTTWLFLSIFCTDLLAAAKSKLASRREVHGIRAVNYVRYSEWKKGLDLNTAANPDLWAECSHQGGISRLGDDVMMCCAPGKKLSWRCCKL